MTAYFDNPIPLSLLTSNYCFLMLSDTEVQIREMCKYGHVHVNKQQQLISIQLSADRTC